jgi:predicted GTPase
MPPSRVLILRAAGRFPRVRELEGKLRAACDTVVVATPIDLRHLVPIRQAPSRVRYDLEDLPGPTLRDDIEAFLAGGKAPDRW